MKTNTRKERGITLIALVVTLITLLILAGITITTLFGENGIINKAQKAKEETQNAMIKEGEVLQNMDEEINKIINPEIEEETYTVIYDYGFRDNKYFQIYEGIKYGEKRPEFKYNEGYTEIVNDEVIPKREGYIFVGWAPALADRVTEDITYMATWIRDTKIEDI